MSTTYIQTFEKQIDQILELLVPKNEQTSIKNDLIKSIRTELGSRLLDAVSNLDQDNSSKVIQDLKKLGEMLPIEKGIENPEEAKKYLSESKQIMDSLDLDFETELETSCKSVLTEFISEISPELPAEKLVELKAIFE